MRQLLEQAARHLTAWHKKYGEHNPEWLPPAGDVKLLEDIEAELAKPQEPAAVMKETPVGPKLFVHGVEVNHWFGCVHDDAVRKISEQINSKAPQQQPAAVPEDWKSVPINSTDEQIELAIECLNEVRSKLCGSPSDETICSLIYDAMLFSAPSPAVQGDHIPDATKMIEPAPGAVDEPPPIGNTSNVVARKSIDTPELRKLLRQIGNWHSQYTSDEIIDMAIKYIDDCLIKSITAALSAQPKQDAILTGLKEAVKAAKQHGFWRSCSGCYETEDGCAVGRYPFSDALGCTLGGGCHECGGLGAVWDDADYTTLNVEEGETALSAQQSCPSNSAESERQADLTAISEAQRNAIREAITEALGDAYDCTRTWSAWGYNTMRQDDFSLVAEDAARVDEITEAAIKAMVKTAQPDRSAELLAALKNLVNVLCQGFDEFNAPTVDAINKAKNAIRNASGQEGGAA